jgi:hypothetical protein
MSRNLSITYKNLMLISATIIASSIIFFGVGIISNIYAQPVQKITITLNSAKLAPLTNDTHVQLKVLVGYVTKDPSLVNTKINGIMKVSALNGTLLKRSSFQNGYVVSQSGIIPFATSFAGKTMQNVKFDIVLTDLSKINPLSNVISSTVNFDNTPAAAAKKSPLSTAFNPVKTTPVKTTP